MRSLSSFASVCLVALASLTTSTAALADDDAKIDARISAWGVACKNRVAATYPKSVMADISVEVGLTQKQAIDAGQITLKDIKQNGLSFNWQYRKHTGYCNTDGNGNITDFVKLQ